MTVTAPGEGPTYRVLSRDTTREHSAGDGYRPGLKTRNASGVVSVDPDQWAGDGADVGVDEVLADTDTWELVT